MSRDEGVPAWSPRARVGIKIMACIKSTRSRQRILENRGNSPRLYRNMLVFIARDAPNAEAWEQSLREYLAWKSIDNEAEPLKPRCSTAQTGCYRLKRTEETLLARLQRVSWLIVPDQPNPRGRVDYQGTASAVRIFSMTAQPATAPERNAHPALVAGYLRMELDRYLWRDQPHLGLKQYGISLSLVLSAAPVQRGCAAVSGERRGSTS